MPQSLSFTTSAAPAALPAYSNSRGPSICIWILPVDTSNGKLQLPHLLPVDAEDPTTLYDMHLSRTLATEKPGLGVVIALPLYCRLNRLIAVIVLRLQSNFLMLQSDKDVLI